MAKIRTCYPKSDGLPALPRRRPNVHPWISCAFLLARNLLDSRERKLQSCFRWARLPASSKRRRVVAQILQVIKKGTHNLVATKENLPLYRRHARRNRAHVPSIRNAFSHTGALSIDQKVRFVLEPTVLSRRRKTEKGRDSQVFCTIART